MPAYNTRISVKNDGLPALKDQITHPKFGGGEVIAVNGCDTQLKCTVRFDATGDERKFLWFIAQSVGAKIVKKHTLLGEEIAEVVEENDVEEEDLNEDALEDVEVDESVLKEDDEDEE